MLQVGDVARVTDRWHRLYNKHVIIKEIRESVYNHWRSCYVSLPTSDAEHYVRSVNLEKKEIRMDLAVQPDNEEIPY